MSIAFSLMKSDDFASTSTTTAGCDRLINWKCQNVFKYFSASSTVDFNGVCRLVYRRVRPKPIAISFFSHFLTNLDTVIYYYTGSYRAAPRLLSFMRTTLSTDHTQKSPRLQIIYKMSILFIHFSYLSPPILFQCI